MYEPYHKLGIVYNILSIEPLGKSTLKPIGLHSVKSAI